MDLRGEGVREVVEGERGLVREDALLLRLEPDRREVFVLARRKVNQAIHAAANSEHAPGAEMMRQ